MNKEEFIGKLQMVYVGDKRASEEIISEYDRLNNIIDGLEEWVKEDVKEEKPDLYFQVLRKIDILDKLKELKENNNE